MGDIFYVKIFEEFKLDNIKNSILKYKPNADKEIKKIINCYNKNLGCNIYHCPNCNKNMIKICWIPGG